ncbi:MAG: DUF350 domain-containing protein [Calditrichaeota bacterium]|nr:MAG: DUF350 domain-containing protein [Calditrichota bacterium]
MTLDNVITGIIYLLSVFILFFLGKLVYDKLNRRFVLKEELVKKDNLALSLAVFGYYLGLVIALGGVLSGESAGFVEDLFDIFFYGIISIILLNISIFINDKVILRKFDNVKEIIEDRNAGTGIVEAANHIAVGLIIYGAMSGDTGDLITAAVFWILGQLVLILAGLFYNWITPYDIHEQIEKDNVAVGVAFAGALIAIGNVIRIGAEGDFISWQYNLSTFFGFVVFGLIMLPFVRLATDKILLPGEKLTDELVHQQNPNIGAGVIEAMSYIAASFLLGWVV